MANAVLWRMTLVSSTPWTFLRCLALIATVSTWLVATWPKAARAEFATVINAPPNVPPGVLNSDTQLNLGPGGVWSLGYDNKLRSGQTDGTSSNIEMNVTGGVIGSPLEIYAGSTLNFSGGSSNYYFYPHDGSLINIGGGVVSYVYAYSGSVTNVSAGSIDHQAEFLSGSVVNVTGGFVGNSYDDSLTVWGGATANISGGGVGRGLNLYGGVVNVTGGQIYDGVDVTVAGSLNLFGDDFRIDGVPVSGLDSIGSSVLPNFSSQATLSGVYSDGTPFAFIMPYNMIAAGRLALHRTAVPAPTPATFNLPGDPLPTGLREGQRVVVGSGATLPAHFVAGRGSQVEIQPGGSFGEGFKAAGAVIDVYGSLAEQTLFATGGSILNLHDGDAPDNGTAYLEIYDSSILNVSGGDWSAVTSRLMPGSTARFSGGTMNYAYAERDVDFAMSGGKVRHVTLADSSVPAVLSGGEIEHLELPYRGDIRLAGTTVGTISWGNQDGNLTHSAGVVRNYFPVAKGATARLEGGAIGGPFLLDPTGKLEIAGGEFRVDGQLVAGLDAPGASLEISVPDGALLSGTLADGTPFAFSSLDQHFDFSGDDLKGKITLIAVATPAVAPGAILAGEHPNLLGVREGQTLVVSSGDVVRDVFNIGYGARVELNAGGTIGERVEAVGAELVMTGGTLGNRFDAFDGSVISISGGNVGQLFEAHPGSQVRISGGKVGDLFSAQSESDVEISGGEMTRAEIYANASFRVNGGTLGTMYLQENARMTVAGGTVNIFEVKKDAHIDLFSGRLGSSSYSAYDQRIVGTVDQYGGIVGESLEIYVGGALNSYVGTVERNGDVYNGGVLNIKGGAVGNEWTVDSGGRINLEQGSLGSSTTINPGGQLTASNGTIGSNLNVYGTATIDDALVGANADVFSGGRLHLMGGALGRGVNGRAGGEIHLYGSEFHVGAEVVDGLNAPGDVVAVDVSTTKLLSGVLADGSPIVLAPQQLSSLGLDGDVIANGVLKLHFAAPVVAPSGVFLASDHPEWFGVRSGQTLEVNAGAAVKRHFTAEPGSAVEVLAGGSVGEQMDALGAALHINGGTIGEGLHAYAGSTVEMTAGSLGANAGLFAGSQATISGGIVGERLAVDMSGKLMVQGGIVGRNLRLAAGAEATFAGGLFADGVSAAANSHVELVGGHFRLNGALLAGFDETTGLLQVNIPANGILTGTFADGTPFAFSSARSSYKDQFAGGTLSLRRTAIAAVPQQLEITMLETTPRGFGVGAELLVSAGGKLADYSILGEGSQTEVAIGGAIGNDVELFSGSLDVAGGGVGSRLAVHNAGVLSLHDGSISSELSINSGGVLKQFGGSVGTNAKIFTGGVWNLFGTSFALNGLLLKPSSPGAPLEIISQAGTLTGTLANGDQFSLLLGPSSPRQNFGPLQGGKLFVHVVPEPSAIVLTAMAIGIIVGRAPSNYLLDRRKDRRPR